MPALGSSTSSDSRLNHGSRRDMGKARISISSLMPCAASAATSSSSERVEWPMVKTVARAAATMRCRLRSELSNPCLQLYRNLSASRARFCPSLEQQAAVGAAEAEGIRQRVIQLELARLVGNIIQVALRVRLFVVDGR